MATIRNIIRSLSNDSFKTPLFAFMVIVIATEYIEPILPRTILYVIATAIVLRPLTELNNKEINDG